MTYQTSVEDTWIAICQHVDKAQVTVLGYVSRVVRRAALHVPHDEKNVCDHFAAYADPPDQVCSFWNCFTFMNNPDLIILVRDSSGAKTADSRLGPVPYVLQLGWEI